MKENFLSKTPERRLENMRLLLHEFQTRATRIDAPFIILTYGSASYGFNKNCYGRLHDIDIFLIIPREINVTEFIQFAKKLFQTTLDINQFHLQELLSGNWEMCRMYGESDGVRLGFRILCSDTFCRLSTKEGYTGIIRNVADVGQSRIIVDVEWSVKQWKYIPTELKHIIVKHEPLSFLVVNQYIFTQNTEQLGAFGRKLLTCTTVYDPNEKAKEVLNEIWRAYIQSCLKHHSFVSTEAIIDSLTRSERFSNSFKRKLSLLINKNRN